MTDKKVMTEQETESDLFRENEWEANRYVARCMRVLSLVAVACWILDMFGVFIIPKIIMNISMPFFLVMALLPTLFCRYNLSSVKYVIMCCVIVGICVLSCFISKHVIIVWTLPLILSCHYYSKKMVRFVLLLSEVLFSASVYVAMYWGEWDQMLLDGAYYAGERVITSELLMDNTLFFVLPRALILLGIYTVCTTIVGRTRGLLEKQARDSEEHQRIRAELNVATHIQTSMLPCIFPAFPNRAEFDIYATMNPAKEVGGDFYDFFLVDDNHLAIVMADVSGKGVPAALFMMISKSLLKSAVQSGLSPDAVLAKVNNELVENNDAEMFVTCWLGIYDFASGKLVFANAGHNAPAVRRSGGAFEFLVFRPGFVLGEMENIRYRTGEIELAPGDEIYLYTDGVTEATDENLALYGNNRLLAALNSAGNVSPREICQSVTADVERFVGNAPQFDDMTMLHLKMLPKHIITVHPTMESMETVLAFAENALTELGVPPKAMVKMNIAADEIFSNIVRYSKAKRADVECGIMGGQVWLRFTDDGCPYDPTEKPDPDTTAPMDDRDAGGMGIFLVKNFMDQVEYAWRDEKNVLTLKKRLD